MTFNKLTGNIAADSNHSINMNTVLKWHLIYIFDHFDRQSTASLISLLVNLQILKAHQLPAHVGLCTSLLPLCKYVLYTHTNTYEHIYTLESSMYIFRYRLVLVSGYPRKMLVTVCLGDFVDIVDVEWCRMSWPLQDSSR